MELRIVVLTVVLSVGTWLFLRFVGHLQAKP
jgi:hypothetical protein